jgi:phosphoenolpyruvate carboxylase
MVTGRDRLLAGHPTLARSIELRNPYVDALSAVQVELLGRLRQLEAEDEGATRASDADGSARTSDAADGAPSGSAAVVRGAAPNAAAIRAVIGSTVNGIAAGLQNTG